MRGALPVIHCSTICTTLIIMEITVLYALILLNVIGAFVNPGVSKSSITFIISSKKSITGPTGNICRKERISHGSLINPKLLGPLQCSIKDPPAEIEVVSVSIESLQESNNSELDEETFKEGKLNASYIVLAILSITFASNQWSRQALYYLCDFSSNSDPFKHINAAVNFNKEQYASLASFGFTVVFAFVSLFAGAVSDRFDRNVVMAISCGVWSVSTALQGFATGSSCREY